MNKKQERYAMTEQDCRERMRAYLAAGRPDDALHVYQRQNPTGQIFDAETQRLVEEALARLASSHPRALRSSIPAWRVVGMIGVALLIAAGILRHAVLSRRHGPPEKSAVYTSDARQALWAQANTLLQTGQAQYEAAHYDEALQTEWQALGMMMQAQNKNGIASALAQVGQGLQAQGRLADAKDVYEKALAVRREIGPPLNLAHLEQTMGGFLISTGDYDRARTCLLDSLRLREQNNDRVGVALCRSDLGALAMERKRYAEAANYFAAARVGAEREHKPEIAASVRAQQGMLAYAQGDYLTARHLVTGSLRFWEQRNHPRWIAGMERRLSQIACREGRYAEALERAEHSLSLYQQVDDAQGQGRTSLTLACALAHTGDKERAQRLYRQAVVGATAARFRLATDQLEDTERALNAANTNSPR